MIEMYRAPPMKPSQYYVGEEIVFEFELFKYLSLSLSLSLSLTLWAEKPYTRVDYRPSNDMQNGRHAANVQTRTSNYKLVYNRLIYYSKYVQVKLSSDKSDQILTSFSSFELAERSSGFGLDLVRLDFFMSPYYFDDDK